MMQRYLYYFLLLLIPIVSNAQSDGFVDNASIIADKIEIDANGNLKAKGNVEIRHNNNILKASKISYSKNIDELSVVGPLSFLDSSNNEIAADSAVFKNDFQEAVLLATKVILENQLEISAEQLISTINDQSKFTRVAATSCQSCENEEPFWVIKANKVVHDKNLKTIYFYDALIEILGFPVLYIPYLRIPDPAVKRATGFLAPEFMSNSRLDFGMKLPFFIPIEEDKDITLTTFLTPNTNTVEIRYRHAFQHGDLILDSAITKDTIYQDDLRGYFSLNGHLLLNNGYNLNYAVERVSDSAYLGDYGYSGRNGLSSGLSYTKAERSRLLETSLGLVQSLYKDDISKVTIDSNAFYTQDLELSQRAGSLYLSTEFVGSWRDVTHDIAGRDVARIGSKIKWQKTSISSFGLEYGGNLQYNYDMFLVSQDSRYKPSQTLNSVGGNLYARYPLISNTVKGKHLLEPLAQIASGWREDSKVVSDESTHTELDMGNLLEISRFAASDRYENGVHSAYGLRYSFDSNENYSFELGFGKVIRKKINNEFTESSGLHGVKSDNFITSKVNLPLNSYLSFQGLIDENMASKKSIFNGGFDYEKIQFEAEYSYLQPDPLELRKNPVEEWSINNIFNINDNWKFSSNLRFDQTEDHLALLGAGLKYENQCVAIKLEMDRRYSQEATSPPTTNFSFAINLKGFSTGRTSSFADKYCGKIS